VQPYDGGFDFWVGNLGYMAISLFLYCGQFLRVEEWSTRFVNCVCTIKSGRSVVGYYEHELWKEKRLYVNRPVKMSDELAEIFRILKIEVPRYDVKLEPYPYNVE